MISVIIPTYNEEKALPATLRHLLTQRGDYEVIVVDGGSTDRTVDIVESLRVTRRSTQPATSSAEARLSTGDALRC